MSSDWVETTLGDICRRQGGSIQTGPFGSQLHTSDYTDKGIPVVMPTNIREGRISQEDIARVGIKDVERLSQHRLRTDDIVFSRRGDVTKNALIGMDEDGWLCGTGCLKVRLGQEQIANPRFISYMLCSPESKDWLIRHAVGATMPNLNTGILAAVPVTLPPLSIQKAIAGTIGALDDRITLLRETNKTLESIAQAIFKSWFIDFDPVRAKMEGRQPEGMDEDTAALFPDSFEESELGLIPRGWAFGRLSDLLKLHKGSVNPGATPSTEYLHYSLPAYDTDMMAKKEFGATIKSNKTTVPENAVLFSKLNPVIPRIWLPVEFGLNAICSTEFLPFVPTSKSNTPFIYCLLKSPGLRDQIVPLASGTSNSHQRIRPDSILSLGNVLPNTLVMEKFEAVVEPLLVRTKSNQLSVQLLSAIRDTLLPRLISGQLRLPEAQEQIEAALS